MEVRIKGTPEFVRGCLHKNDIFLQMESAGYITDKWRPFMPFGNLAGMVKRTKSGIVIMRD